MGSADPEKVEPQTSFRSLQTTEDGRREENDCFDETQGSLHRDARQSKREQEEPNEGIENERSQSKRPAKEEKNEPE